MKKIIFTILIALSATTSLSAQEIYAEIRRTTQAKISDPTVDVLIRRFNFFKLEALNYMAIKMKEEFPDSSAELLDKEALSLNIFMTNYTKALIENSRQPASYQKKIVQAFMDASYSNPMFNDPDKELVLSFFMDASSLTRFSLDTDWRRAVPAAKEALKRIK